MWALDPDLHPEPGIEAPAFVAESMSLSLAFSAARRAHSDHTRGGHGRPYFEHPIQVAELLRDEGFDEEVCAAGLLHDTVEDSDFTVEDVVRSFGPKVGGLVAALTEDPSIEDWEARKLALRESAQGAGPECAAIYVADKLANLHDWRQVYSEVGERAVEFFKAPTLDARVRAWRADLEMGERASPGLSLNSYLRRELEQFERERQDQIGR
jgi:(p)ppGpp synthase/HD superfamily hydrolase